ncbi:MAG: SusC/RagA family TonB-linked outer membrane protein, partial [Prevotella sp.]|nr:SusC/RagA family TonB-linked outer membrane protein [Prevotella sp.]
MYKMNQLSTRRVCITSALAALLLAGAPVNYAMAYGGVTGIQQTASVKGVVVDQTGEAIIGATVKVLGSQKGAISDFEGNFTIDAQRGDQLEVSYIGYKTQVIKVAGQHVKVTLLEDSKALQEVVVVGFGTQKKVNLTGAVSVVDGDELAQRPVANAAQALQGVVPGLQIASTSGSLDASPSINVRGTATIGEGSSGSPLILIDGMEGDLNTINPQDIQSISVLKDAAASSIYGSRAPFGVILITTKSGSKDSKVKVNYNNSFRFSNLIRGKHMMNSVDYASWLNDAKTNQGQSVFFDAERMAAIKEYHDATPVGPGTRRTADGKLVYAIGSQNGVTWDDGYGYGIDEVDWYDVVYRNSAFSQEHNASVNGGSDKLNFYASIGYLDQGGFMNMGSDGYKRYNGTAKMNIELAKWIRMNYNMRFARTNYHRPAALTSSLYNDMARQGWPMLPLYDRNGYLYSS